MFKKYIIIVCLIAAAGFARSQDTLPATIPVTDMDNIVPDSSIDYDELLNELDLFLDSILSPRSYALASLSVGQGYFSFIDKSTSRVTQVKKFIWSPTFGYYDKDGLGLTLTSYIIRDSAKSNLYQFSIGPSYDYLKNRKLAAGISFTRYFTKRSLPFYTSPLQSELNGYFLWRKSWLQPGIMANLGWGSRTEYNKREVIYKRLVASAVADGTIRIIDTVTILTRNRESIRDFTLAASLRHDFYWLDIFSNKDHIRFSPLLSLSGGTQKFGFNQTTGAYGSLRALALNNTRNVSLEQKFQLISMTLYLRSEYSIGKFFIQPQLLFDYYFPGEGNKFISAFSVNAGFMF